MNYDIKSKWNKNNGKRIKNINIIIGKNLFMQLIKILLCLTMIIFLSIKINNIKYGKDFKSKTKVCLCCIAKWENLYISNFIKHYISLGYNQIYLYDNNDIYYERIDDIVQSYIDSGYLTLLNFRGYRGYRDNAQMDAYYDCYKRYNSQCNWISFFDIDEFMYIDPINDKNLSIQEFLDKPEFNGCESVKINWKSFGDSGLLYYEDKPVTERFTEFSKFRYEFGNVKSIIRTNLSKHLKKTQSPHTIFSNVIGCLSSGRRKKFDFYNVPPEYKGAHIKHYVTKTISEFCNKLNRGYALKTIKLDNKKLASYFSYFFWTNKKTQEKVDIFNKAFNTSFK